MHVSVQLERNFNMAVHYHHKRILVFLKIGVLPSGTLCQSLKLIILFSPRHVDRRKYGQLSFITLSAHTCSQHDVSDTIERCAVRLLMLRTCTRQKAKTAFNPFYPEFQNEDSD